MNTKALAAKFSYGDTVSHSEMDTFLGIVKPTYQGDIVKYEDEMKAYALTRLNRLEKFIEKLLKEEKIYLIEQQNHLAAMKANINKQRRKPF